MYFLAQLLLLDTGRFLSWDEAVYISEVSPYAEAVGMGAHRARGVTFLIAPVTSITDSMLALRLYLAVVSSAALFGAFVAWCRTIGWAAPIGMGLFASSWITVFFGSSVYPNFYTAVLAVAAIGLAAGLTEPDSRQRLAGIGGLVALATLVRPLDGLTLAICLVIVGLVLLRGSLVTLAVVGAAGLLVGAIPWVVEAFVRFGGPLQRLETSGEIVGSGIRNNVVAYLQILDGSGSVNWMAAGWLAVLLLLGAASIFDRTAEVRRLGLVCLTSAALFAAPYLFATEPVLERFLLPGLALLAAAAALGLTCLVTRLGLGPVGIAFIGVVLVAASAWNLPALAQWDDRQARNAETALILGEAVADESEDAACFVLSEAYHPAVAFAAGCEDSWSLSDSAESNNARVEQAREAGLTPVVVTVNEDPGSVLGEGWRCRPVDALVDRGWQLCFLGGG